jgi:glutamate synthase (NADPH/NADH) small chain
MPATSSRARLLAKGKHVVVIGGGDTGSDCVGTSNRHGAKSVTQFELLPQPPEEENKPLVWPYWPIKLRTSSSHDEGCERDWAVATKRFEGKNGKVEKLIAVRVEWKDGKMQEVPGSEFEMKADLVLLAMGFTQPVSPVLEAFGVDKDARGNVRRRRKAIRRITPQWTRCSRRAAICEGRQWPVAGAVWAIRFAEGRQCARLFNGGRGKRGSDKMASRWRVTALLLRKQAFQPGMVTNDAGNFQR